MYELIKLVTVLCCRALLEAQEIFGLDFDDPNEFARVAEEGLGSEEEEEVEDDDVSSWNTIHFAPNKGHPIEKIPLFKRHTCGGNHNIF